MFNNQYYQENPEFQRHAAWNPYQQGPLPQHQDQYRRWPIYQQQQPHQYQHQMYHQQVEQERHRQLQIQHHQQQQQLERERQLQAHRQGPQLPQHPQPHHQQHQLHEQPQPAQHHLNQQHPQHHLPAQPQQEHNQFYPQPQPQPQPQEPSQPHQQQHHHQQVQHQQQQRQLQEDHELNNFNRTHQITASQQLQQGVRDQVAHQPRPQLDQDDNVEMLIEIDEDIEEIIWRAGPSHNQANEDLPPQQKSEPACCEQLRDKTRQDAIVIETLKREVEELKRKLGAYQGVQSIKVEVGEAQQSSSPSLNAIGPSSSSPLLPASPPQLKRGVPRVKEEPRSPSPPVDQVGSYQEACHLWTAKYTDDLLAEHGLTLDLKEYLFHPANSRIVPQEVKNVRPHCLYKSLHPDKGKSNHIQWGKLANHEKDIWQRISEKIKCRQLRQEREGLVMRRNGRAVAPSARNTFNPHQMPIWNLSDTRPVPHLYQNVFHN